MMFDKWYYVLGNVGVFDYQLNTPIQKVGVFMTVLNSAINPFIYLLFMQAFRRKFFLWVRNRCRPVASPYNSNNSHNNSTASEKLTASYTRGKLVNTKASSAV